MSEEKVFNSGKKYTFSDKPQNIDMILNPDIKTIKIKVILYDHLTGKESEEVWVIPDGEDAPIE